MTRILLAAFLLSPLPALAHTGDHSHSGWLHLLTEPDHLAFAALAVAGVALMLRARRHRTATQRSRGRK